MRILAAIMFYTRLPLWRVVNIEARNFNSIITYLPLVGVLTSGVMLISFLEFCRVLSPEISWLLAIMVRIFFTGALHEDGLADFFDGFGGGITKEKILSIMKDSHIGTFGVLALVGYFFLLYNLMPYNDIVRVVIAGDVFSKFLASQLVNVLPYARRAEDSKSGFVYDKMNSSDLIVNVLVGIGIPLLLLPHELYKCLLFPAGIFVALWRYMKYKIEGYTGDCCGATILITEIAFYLAVRILLLI